MTWSLVYTKQAQKDAKKLVASGLKNKAVKHGSVQNYASNLSLYNIVWRLSWATLYPCLRFMLPTQPKRCSN